MRVLFGFHVMVLILLTSCFPQLQGPICSAANREFPEEFFGKYKSSVFSSDEENSGAGMVLEFIIDVSRSDLGPVARVQQANGSTLKALPKQLAKIAAHGFNRHGQTTFSEGVLDICKVGDHYFEQSRSGSNLYSVSRLDFSHNAIVVTPMIFAVKDMAEAKVPVSILPDIEGFTSHQKDPWDVNMFAPVRVIVGNIGISPERVMSGARPYLAGITLTRMP